LNIVVDNLTCLCINETENSSVDCTSATIQENDIPISDTKTLELYKNFKKLKTTTNSNELSIDFFN
jgi:hypothetical protein